MKCKQAESYILLEQSGELTPHQRRILTKHLVSCEPCRTFQAETKQLTSIIRVPEEKTEISDFTRHRIHQEAASHLSAARKFSKQRHKEPFIQAGHMVLVYATVFILVFAGWSILRQHSNPQQGTDIAQVNTQALAWDNGLDEELEELDNMLVVALQEWQDDRAGEWYSDDTAELAEELLLLEESS